MTRNIFTEKVKQKFPTPKTDQPLVLELKELIKDWQHDYDTFELNNYPIVFIKLKGRYHKGTVTKVFSKLGLTVTKVARKHGRYKTIVHFK